MLLYSCIGMRTKLLIYIFALYHRKSTVQYNYKPLENGNIRLIHLKPGAKDEPLKAIIVSISLEQASGTYEAISYAWEGGTKYYDLITEEALVFAVIDDGFSDPTPPKMAKIPSSITATTSEETVLITRPLALH
jgi:hypothetical protein